MHANATKTIMTQRPFLGAEQAPCLVHIYPTGPTMGRRFPCSPTIMMLGRCDECDVCIPDTSISRRHARIESTPEGYVVADLQSTNGTFVNDVRIAGPVLLRDGDYLRIGNCIYRFLGAGNIELAYHEEIYRLTILDGLTQIHNRRYLMEFLDTEVGRAQRYERPFSLLIFDIDKFKSINDKYSHLGGDYVLRELSLQVRPTIRKGDLFARYGGEEFAICLVETGLEQAIEVAERLRVLVADHPFEFGDRQLRVTISIGVASMTDLDSANPTSLVEKADCRLYRAKELGRNRVVASSQATVPC